MCISVNCITANQLIFSTEQCGFIYDQYLLIHSATQVRRREISMREIERVFHDTITIRDLWPACSPDMTPYDFYL